MRALRGWGAFASKSSDPFAAPAPRRLDFGPSAALRGRGTVDKRGNELMRTHLACSAGRFALMLLAVSFAASARAEEAPYVGTWALEVANCGKPQEDKDAPLVIAKDRYDQHEVHCTFKSVEAKGGDYKIAGDCMVEGNPQAYDFTLTVSGDTLTFTDEAGARDFLRCK